MQIKDVIREKRKACGLTQEQVAEYLGVSAPAVNKWEAGATYPDITLLSSLARLLKTDLNTLLCFRENITDEDIARYTEVVAETGKSEGIEKAVLKIQEKLREYPASAGLLYHMAVTLHGLLALFPCGKEQEEEYQKYILELYERTAECKDTVYAERARYMIASKKIQEEDYDGAQRMIDMFPEYTGLDRRQLEITMFMKQKKSKEAAKALEQKLNRSIQEVFLLLNQLSVTAVWEGENERAWELAGYSARMMEIYGWEYYKYSAEFSVAMEEKDADKCVGLLEKMLEVLTNPPDMEKSILFAHIRKEKRTEDEKTEGAESTIRNALFTALEKDENCAFLRESPKYEELMKKYNR